MSVYVRAGFVVAVVAVATWGEGGATPASLLITHVMLATAVAICAAAPGRSPYAPSPRPVAAWLCFAALAALGALFAPYAYAAWLVLVEIIAFGALFWLASGDPPVTARLLAPAIAALASAHGLAAVVQKLSGSARPASTFLNPNHLAAWLAGAGLFVAGAILAPDLSRRGRQIYGAAIGLALAGIFVSGSRGAVVGIAAGTAALVALFFGHLAARTRRILIAGAIVFVVGAALGAAVRLRSEDDPHRFRRTAIWAASVPAAWQSPLLGVGPGQFAASAQNLNFPLEHAPLRFERTFRSPHSDVLRAACEFGFPAAIAAFSAVALAAWELFRRRTALSSVERGAVAALVALGAQSWVDDLSTRPAIVMLGAALAGLVLSRRRDEPATGGPRVAAGAAAILIVFALGVGEVTGFVAWSLVKDLPRGHLDAAQLARLRRSLALNPMQPSAWERLSEHFVGDGRSWTVADYAAAREAAEHAIRLQPADAFYRRAAARVEATATLSILPFQTTRERAARLYDDAGRLARTDATIPLEAAKFLMQAGDAAGAERSVRRALEIEPRAATPRLWLAQAILQGNLPGRAAEAETLLAEAQALAPAPSETPTSSYAAALRGVDPNLVEALRRELATQAGR